METSWGGSWRRQFGNLVKCLSSYPFVGATIFLTLVLSSCKASFVPLKILNESLVELSPEECGHVCNYEDWFNRAHCDGRELLHVPTSGGCEEVTLLELQHNKIKGIAEEHLSGYKHVRTLDVSNNEITHLNPATFLANDQLKNIIVSHNRLRILHNGTFKGIESNLLRIYLNHNKLYLIETKAFHGLSKVTSLYLNNNKLQQLAPNIFSDMTDLLHLSLGFNELIELDKGNFRNLTKLLTLKLEANNLTRLPQEIFFDLYSLQEVDLSYNKLETIMPPQSIGIRYVQMINLQDNTINRSADIIPFLYNVTHELCFGGNPLSCDCDFKIIQEWVKEIKDGEPCSESAISVVRCKLINQSFVDITDDLKLNCNGPISSNKTSQETDLPDKKDSPSSTPAHTFASRSQQLTYPSGHDDNDDWGKTGHFKPQNFKSAYSVYWISLYNAVILTCYILFRCVKSYK